MALTLRLTKGLPLTYAEGDANITDLSNRIGIAGNGVGINAGNYSSIQAALDAAVALNVCRVVIPYGNYSETLSISGYVGQNLAIVGEGARILVAPNSIGLTISSCENVSVSGISFYGAAASGASQAGINVTLSSRVRIMDNDFRLLTYGINWVSSALGIVTAGVVQIPSLVSRNIFKACAVGVILGGSGSSTAAEYVCVSGNIINDCTVQGILCQAGNGRITDNTLTGNIIGIEVDGSTYPNADHGAVIGNTLNHNSKCGLYVHDTSADYSYLITANNIWANIYGNFGAGSYAHPFGVILKNCANVNFTNNIVARNTVNLGIDVLTTSFIANNTFISDSTLTIFNIYEISTITVANGNKMAPNTFQGALVAAANNNDYEQTYVIGTTGAPAFENSAANFGSGFSTAAYQKDAAGIVHLRGVIVVALNVTAFTLPAGFRPATKITQSIISNNLVGRTEISSAGAVNIPVGAPATWASIDGISFKAEA